MRFVWYIWGDFCAIDDGNSDNLEIRVPDESRSLKVTPLNSSRVSSYQSLIFR